MEGLPCIYSHKYCKYSRYCFDESVNSADNCIFALELNFNYGLQHVTHVAEAVGRG